MDREEWEREIELCDIATIQDGGGWDVMRRGLMEKAEKEKARARGDTYMHARAALRRRCDSGDW